MLLARELRSTSALERPHVDVLQLGSPLRDPGAVRTGKEPAARDRVRRERPPHGLFEVVLSEGGLRSVDGVRGNLDVHPCVRWELQLIAPERVHQLAVETDVRDRRAELA